MGNSNSNDINKNKPSMLKSPRKIFSKNKRPNKNLFYFNKRRHSSSDDAFLKGHGHEVVDPHLVKLTEDEDGGSDGNENKPSEQVAHTRSSVTAGNAYASLLLQPQSDLINLHGGGVKIIGNTDKDNFLKNNGTGCGYLESESECLDGNVLSVCDSEVKGVGSPCSASFVTELEGTSVSEKQSALKNKEPAERCSEKRTTKSQETVENAQFRELNDLEVFFKSSGLITLKQIDKKTSDQTYSLQETTFISFDNLAANTSVIVSQRIENEDVTDDITNTSFSDLLSTTPYYSPDEDFDNIFDSDSKQGGNMDVTSKIFSKENAFTKANVSSAKTKDENVINEKELLKPNNSSFTVVKHKKVELSPTTFQSPKTCAESKGSLSSSCRHSSLTDSSASSGISSHESNVLRKVASLTFENAFMDQKVHKSKFVPEKIDFQIYKKFEGQRLINWFLSSLSNKAVVNQKHKNTERYTIVLQFCTQLLSLGVIQQIVDKNAGLEDVFKPNLMYYWTHAEISNASTYTPERVGSMARFSISRNNSHTELVEAVKTTTREKEDDVEILKHKLHEKEKTISELEDMVEKLQRRIDCSRTVSDIQELTKKMKTEFEILTESKDEGKSDDISPNKRSPDQKKCYPRTEDIAQQISSENLSDSKKLNNNSQKFGNCFDATSPTNVPAFSFSHRMQYSKIPVPLHKSNSISHVPIGVNDNNVLCISRTKSSVDVHEAGTPQQLLNNNYLTDSLGQPNDSMIAEVSNETECSVTQLPSCQSFSSQTLSTQTVSLSTTRSATQFDARPTSNGVSKLRELSLNSLEVSSSIPSSTISVVLPPPLPLPPPPPPPTPLLSIVQSPVTSVAIPPPPPPPLPPLSSHSFLPPPPPPLPSQLSSSSTFSSQSPLAPPPPPPFCNIAASSLPSVSQVAGVIAPPSPSPFPPPPLGGWNAQRATFRKQPLSPKIPMKPLYWTRLVVPEDKNMSTPSPGKQKLLWEEIEEPSINDEEFMSLFSRQVVEKKVPKKKIEKPVKFQVIKLLDSKRSQNVGILASSLHLDFSEIENAVYNFDTSIVSLEVLQQIHEIRATDEEIKLIKDYLLNHPESSLDKPEQFLLELSEIPHFAERVACFVIQSEFNDSVLSVRNKLSNIKATCEKLMSSEELKKVMAIILALGNFMNGGNLQRGQADGFGLDILPKLKDVKSKDNSLTLLHYIVKTYLKMCADPLTAALPIPEPSDVEQAAFVQFDDIKQQLQNLKKDLEDCKRKLEKIVANEKEESIETFKIKMEKFLSDGKQLSEEAFENLEESKKKFQSVLKFYHFQPKGLALGEEPSPKDFFPLWYPFCTDFKSLWRIEQQNLLKEKLKETRQKEKERRTQIKKYKRRESGLKANMKNIINDLEDD